MFSSASSKSSASVVDGKLILSFPGAVRPSVWQMDLTQVKSSALEVVEQGAHHVLAFKGAKGEASDVAVFLRRDQALQALLAASKAMEGAHGHIRPGSGDSNFVQGAAPVKQKRGWAAPILGILLILVLLFLWANLAPVTPESIGAADGAVAPAPAPSGIPMSADDFLKNMQ